jgi:hypothetical protein
MLAIASTMRRQLVRLCPHCGAIADQGSLLIVRWGCPAEMCVLDHERGSGQTQSAQFPNYPGHRVAAIDAHGQQEVRSANRTQMACPSGSCPRGPTCAHVSKHVREMPLGTSFGGERDIICVGVSRTSGSPCSLNAWRRRLLAYPTKSSSVDDAMTTTLSRCI